MKTPDLEKEQSERELSLPEFLEAYNEDLPSRFPKASLPALKKFKTSFPGLFKERSRWTLEHHRKKVMDWLPRYEKSHD